MEKTYSIQGADLETREEGPWKTPGQMAAMFQSFNWPKEHALQKRLEAAGEDNCPPGLSLVREVGVFLHLCPNEDGNVMTHCIHTQPSKFLGLFATTKRTNLFVERLHPDTAINAIAAFMRADEDWLSNNIKED